METNVNSELPAETMDAILECILSGQKIAAIKLYRECRSTSLVEAKAFIEQLTEELKRKYPEKFSQASATGCASTAVRLLAILMASAGLPR